MSASNSIWTGIFIFTLGHLSGLVEGLSLNLKVSVISVLTDLMLPLTFTINTFFFEFKMNTFFFLSVWPHKRDVICSHVWRRYQRHHHIVNTVTQTHNEAP